MYKICLFHSQYSFKLNININSSLIFIRLQEVGSIIGKKGEIVNRFREEVSQNNSSHQSIDLLNVFFSFFFPVWCQNQHFGWLVPGTHCNGIWNNKRNLLGIYANYKEIRRGMCALD